MLPAAATSPNVLGLCADQSATSDEPVLNSFLHMLPDCLELCLAHLFLFRVHHCLRCRKNLNTSLTVSNLVYVSAIIKLDTVRLLHKDSAVDGLGGHWETMGLEQYVLIAMQLEEEQLGALRCCKGLLTMRACPGLS